jgi:CHASE2 domain-containing sensor protein
MSKVVILNLGQGNFKTGFPQITATLYQVGEQPLLNKRSKLPANLELNQIFEKWLLLYETYSNSFRKTRMEIAEATVERYSEKAFKDLAKQLEEAFNTWLNDSEFNKNIVQSMIYQLKPEDAIQVLISTKEPIMRQFPWHLWDFFEHYPKAEISLCSPEFQFPYQADTPIGKVRILAILGNCQEIDLKKDKKKLESLPGVELQFLPDPSRTATDRVTREMIDEYLWDKNGWDILFFAGHSQTRENQGVLAINENEELTIDDLKFALKKAIANGLKLAIFNSCDGLGLAKQLEELHIPQVIVMRYPIPDAIAHQFLKHFIVAFSSHQSLHTSVREAREKLQGLEDRYPCASWLPVLFQNPAFIPSTWKSLRGERVSLRQILPPLFLTSLVCTGLVLGLRSLGFLQSVELKAYDYLMRLRPLESADGRILLIAIAEDDIKNQPIAERNKASLSDRMLEKVLNKLARSDAVAIALDLYREISVQKDYPVLAKWMGESDRFLAICKYDSEVVPPPDVPPERQGFNNVLLDTDETIRRSLLAVETPKPCQNPYSFSFQLARTFIAKTHPEYVFEPNNPEGYIQIGKTVFKTLDLPSGGYQKFDPLGHQILLNYRNTPQIAEMVTLGDFLEQYPLERIGKRIVIIGTIAPSFNDHRWYTSIGKMSGIEVQAHLTSQILSTVLDERPLIWTWNIVIESLWIFAWSWIGGLLVWQLRSVDRLLLGYGVAVIILGVSCWGVFIFFGGWIPLVPSVLVLLITGGTFLYCQKKQFI